MLTRSAHGLTNEAITAKCVSFSTHFPDMYHLQGPARLSRLNSYTELKKLPGTLRNTLCILYSYSIPTTSGGHLNNIVYYVGTYA